MRLSGVSHGRYQLAAPFGLRFDAQREARFHFIGRGAALLRTDSLSVPLNCGDAVLLPQGVAHELISGEVAACTDVAGLKPGDCVGGIRCLDEGAAAPDGASRELTALLFSGSMTFDLDTLHPLIALMPEVMPVHALAAQQPELPPLLEAMSREVAMDRAGAAGILSRLADVVAASIVRGWVEGGCCSAAGWVEALRDPRLGRVIVAIHKKPARNWTVASLAAIMGASRSSFADRFASVTGKTPLRYVVEVRMRLATRWLEQEKLPIETVATRLGYGSHAAFGRAFKRITGGAPGRRRDLPATPRLDGS